jgi:hypothetical protein
VEAYRGILRLLTGAEGTAFVVLAFLGPFLLQKNGMFLKFQRLPIPIELSVLGFMMIGFS